MTDGRRAETLLQDAKWQCAKDSVGFVTHRVGVVSRVGRHHFHPAVGVFDLSNRSVHLDIESFGKGNGDARVAVANCQVVA